MYQPPHFREDRLDVQHGLIRAHPLGLLITHGGAGLSANPIPFSIDNAGELGVLRGHLARANPQWRDCADAECLVVFQGPQHYVTPSWYATKRETGRVVPTWNYVTVHAWGRPTVHDDPVWLKRQIVTLTDERERSSPEPWAVDDAPDAYIDGQIRGIVGIEITIARLEGKWKVSQNRSTADRAGVSDGLTRDGRVESAALVAAGAKG